MPQKRLLVDLDGTLARFHDEANYLERMFEEGFFEHLEPFENMVEAIRLFMKYYPDVQVCPCSAAVQSPYCKAEKNAWLDQRLPEIPKENRIYTEMGRSKAEYLPGGVTKDDYLLDDYNRGLHQFLFSGGSAIKCHNNINQKGMGTHGGERGYMWEGPMIHANDPPELIVAELAQLMGLEHDIKKAAESCNIRYNEVEKRSKAKSKDPTKALFITPIQEKGSTRYAVPGMDNNNSWMIYFQNPYNALRWLNRDPLAYEYNLCTSEGETITASGYQLEAICQNAYGNGDFKQFMRADRAQLADDVKNAFNHREDAVVGFLCQCDFYGHDYDLIRYYDPESMMHQMKIWEGFGQAYHAEWFVEPPALQNTHAKDNAPPSFANILEDANRRAIEAQNGDNSGKEPELHS